MLVGSRTDAEPAAPFGEKAEVCRSGREARQILEQAAATGRIDLEIGRIDTAAAADQGLLSDLADARRRHNFGFELSCEIGTIIGVDEARLLANAGVKRVRLGERLEGGGGAPNWMRQTEVAKRLHQAGLGVEWALDVEGEESVRCLLSHPLHTFVHLPPPCSIGAVGADGLDEQAKERVRSWSSLHRPGTLSFARGPGFYRIFDRRIDPRSWRFVTVSGFQADILGFCLTTRSSEELCRAFGERHWNDIAAFLDDLVSLAMACRCGDWFQTLPVRRTKNERWTSGDY